MKRHPVSGSDRIAVTERLLTRRAPERVLEIEAGDCSFEYLMGAWGAVWVKADFAPPCDVRCSL